MLCVGVRQWLWCMSRARCEAMWKYLLSLKNINKGGEVVASKVRVDMSHMS